MARTWVLGPEERKDKRGQEMSEEHFWRCCHCHQMTTDEGTWIEDSVAIGDSWESVVARNKRAEVNGSMSLWCDKCIKNLKQP